MSSVSSPAIRTAGAMPRLRWRSVVGYGFGDAGCNVAFQMTGLFLLVFYTDVVGIEPAHAGNIFLFVKIWDAFADLVAGRIVDRTMTRWGKFRPFLLWYSVPLLAANLLCFWIPVDGYGARLAWATVSYALLGLLYSMVNIPYGSLAGAMSQHPVDRSRLASARMVGSGVTILLLSIVLAPQLKSSDDLATTFALTAVAFLVVGAAMFATTFFTSRETVVRDVDRVSLRQTLHTLRANGPLLRLCVSSFFYLTAQNVVSAISVYVANDVLARYPGGGNWLATVVIIITTGAVIYVGPIGPMVTRLLGKRRGFVLAGLGSVVGGLLFAASNSLWHSLPLSLLGLFLVGFGMGLLNTMTWAMEADTVEFGEFRTGLRTEGATYAAFSFTRKVGQAVGAALASYILALVAYDGTRAEQDPAVADGIALWAGLLPAAIFLIAVGVMATYPLTEKRFAQLMTVIVRRRVHRVADDFAPPRSGDRPAPAPIEEGDRP
ncbi:glucuronide transporter [Tersicoccus solisilvae]|uniref:Glucuronide transporter n=1 Tax=Tersicoccus solisilvae TaxID=1882339 RepID=A0ABQ1P8M7_9MICC|nr:glycoside-pentoside-hexuronide (GPH):cation symporter [Tersicoccus solisilvae]GGC93360.1 glucuronide transporter [Tersicoccus solisilvae]